MTTKFYSHIYRKIRLGGRVGPLKYYMETQGLVSSALNFCYMIMVLTKNYCDAGGILWLTNDDEHRHRHHRRINVVSGQAKGDPEGPRNPSCGCLIESMNKFATNKQLASSDPAHEAFAPLTLEACSPDTATIIPKQHSQSMQFDPSSRPSKEEAGQE